MDSLRVKISFLLSCFLHFLLFFGVRYIPKNKPIVISFPVELITLPSVEKVIEDKVTSNLVRKEEIIIPKKTKKKKQEVKKTEEPKKQEVPQTTASNKPTTLPSLSLETAKFPFSYYVNQIRKKIVENWMWSHNYPGELKTVVYFRILKDGNIYDLKIKESSGNRFYDNLCLRAVELAQPFPPLPVGFNEDYLGVFFEFKYHE
ncbi:MAG: energy transducer TonB [Elusimicrobiota bacterium]|nr:TonB C-terminal domain-containing protein [Endomicrobiia bacterium]MDW8165757.1 energy transducer TonB [Elusimicrobiota bacterium]